MKLLFTFLCLLFLALNASAQTFLINGKVTDEKGDPVPFASVYLKNTSRGTSANSEGLYQLKLAAGKYDLVFKAIGYRQQSRELLVGSDITLDVRMTAEVYELKDVEIRADGEDPAYAIMRKAIKRRKDYLKEVKSYTTEVYIKGMQKMLAAPKKFLGKDVAKMGKEIGLESNRRGIIYLSESDSKLSFMQPDPYREEMISSKVSGSHRAFSFNRASDIKVNLYENFQDWEGLSNRPIISPLSDNALFYYQYKYLGSAVENGLPVNKIAVIPRRNTDPVFRGIIYIMEDSWRLHSLDLYITKAANINFVDTLKINQQYIPGHIHVPAAFEDIDDLEEFLSEKRGRKVEILTPQRGIKKQMLQLAQTNAKHSFDARFRVMKPSSKQLAEALQEVFGTPEPDGTWALRYEGHHMSLNWTIVKGKAIAAAPQFLGSNPGDVKSGPLEGTRALGELEDLGRAFVTSLLLGLLR